MDSLWLLRFGIVFLLIDSTHQGGLVKLHFRSFANPNHKLVDDSCCEGMPCSGECDNYFKICLKQPEISSACSLGSLTTDELGGDRMNFPNYLTFSDGNPIDFTFSSWKASFSIKIEVWDKDDGLGNYDDHVANLQKDFVIQPSINKSVAPVTQHILSYTKTKVKLVMDVSVYCKPYYFAPNCSIYCKATDDNSGHYTCDYDRAHKLCLKGWYGSNCLSKALPCIPRDNWSGHYTCEPQSGKRICIDGWIDTSTLCTQSFNDCHSSPCSNGMCIDKHKDFSCTCPAHYQGKRCEKVIPICPSKPCARGVCSEAGVGKFKCACPDGYTGIKCETDVDDCQSSPCLNNGACVDKPNDFSCSCPVHYEGKRCEKVISSCKSSPCLRGSCSDAGVGKFKCACPDGYIGIKCETDIDDCQSSPCLNNGACVDKPNDFSCSCPAHYDGKRCEKVIPVCPSKPCARGACSEAGVGKFKCTCPDGYTGFKCETDIDDCQPSPCLNNGACVDKPGNFSCSCSVHYEGRRCEKVISSCLSNPCVRGSCSDSGVGQFKCSCPHGYTGAKCETDIDDCQSSPCLNNGACVDEIGNFTCSCPVHYEGRTCEIDIDDCQSSPCLNNGACVDEIGNFSCSCPFHYEGRRCEIVISRCKSNPCVRGSCSEAGVGKFKCACPDGYTGMLCETDVDDCLFTPCQNNGSCSDGVNTFSCQCIAPYIGQRCEIMNQTSTRLISCPISIATTSLATLAVPIATTTAVIGPFLTSAFSNTNLSAEVSSSRKSSSFGIRASSSSGLVLTSVHSTSKPTISVHIEIWLQGNSSLWNSNRSAEFLDELLNAWLTFENITLKSNETHPLLRKECGLTRLTVSQQNTNISSSLVILSTDDIQGTTCNSSWMVEQLNTTISVMRRASSTNTRGFIAFYVRLVTDPRDRVSTTCSTPATTRVAVMSTTVNLVEFTAKPPHAQEGDSNLLIIVMVLMVAIASLTVVSFIIIRRRRSKKVKPLIDAPGVNRKISTSRSSNDSTQCDYTDPSVPLHESQRSKPTQAEDLRCTPL